MSVQSSHEPESFAEAFNHSCWRDAMQEEINAQEKRMKKTQSHCLQGNKPLAASGFTRSSIKRMARQRDTKLDQQLKDSFKNIESNPFKDRENICPRLLNTIRGILALAAIKKWPLFQLDVKNAFQQHKGRGIRKNFYSASSNSRLLFSQES